MNYSKKIEDDRSYRYNELFYLITILSSFRGSSEEKVLIRSGILLLYAHWEGFCKKSTGYYIDYFKNSGEPIANISKDILINNIFSEKGKIINYMKIWTIKHIFGKTITTKDLNIKFDKDANLNYSVLKDKYLTKVGITNRQIEKQFKNNLANTELSKLDFVDKGIIKKYFTLVDGKLCEKIFDSHDNFFLNTSKILLHYRNEIGHGKANLCLTYNEFIFIYESIRALILSYKDVLINLIED